MPNLVTNKIVLIGPRAEVEDFLSSAVGPADLQWGAGLSEASVIRDVRSGTSIETAFREANNRIDALLYAGAASRISDDEVAIPPVAASDFEAWAADIEGARHMPPIDHPRSHLSLPTLIPPPAEVLAESYHLVGYHWCLANWGVKWGIEAASAAAIADLPDGRAMASFDGITSANSAPLGAMKAISERFPALAIMCAWADLDGDDFGCEVFADGVSRADTSCSSDDFGPDCFEYDPEDEESYLLIREALNSLVYGAIAVMDRADDPAPRR